MANSEVKLLEGKLAEATKQALDSFKEEGTAEADLEFVAVTAEPVWNCYLHFKESPQSDRVLRADFTLQPGASLPDAVRSAMKKAFDEKNWMS